MEKIADGFIWPVRDPDWLVKILIIGLIHLIPIVGAINGLGWMLATLDRLRAGEDRMAPANFSYLGRGVRLFVVQLGYGVSVAILTGLFYIPGVLLALQSGHGQANTVLIGLSVFLSVLSFAVATIGTLSLTFLTPSLVLATDQGGFAGGFNVSGVLRRARANLSNTLIAGLMLIAAGLISSLGSIVCLIGVVFTAAYALAVQAWIFRSFEVGSQAKG